MKQNSLFRLTAVLLVLICCIGAADAQELPRYKKIVKQLSSAKYQGRGYARDGVRKAGQYIAREFEKSGVDEVTLQPFTLDINTCCGDMEMWADGRKLVPGIDFSMREYSPGVHGEIPV